MGTIDGVTLAKMLSRAKTAREAGEHSVVMNVDDMIAALAELTKARVEVAKVEEREARVIAALDIAFRYTQIDGEHHKEWAIDQMVRALTGPGYEGWVRDHNAGEDGPATYSWSVGIAP